MSTKIWVAWRVPLSRFPEASDLLDSLMFERALQRYSTLCEHHAEGERLKKDHLGDKRWAAFEVGTTVFKAAHISERTPYDLQCGFRFFIDILPVEGLVEPSEMGHVYIIPYGEGMDSITVPDWFEDFHYQNQTDRPSHITKQEYRFRAETWERIWFNHPGQPQHLHTVIEPRWTSDMTRLQMAYWKTLETENRGSHEGDPA